MNELHEFARLVQALDPWRAQLVFIGGWAHRLHRLHPLANSPEHAAVLTRDTDLALDAAVPLEGDIRDALAKQGFKEEFHGDDNPAAARYSLGKDNAGFYAEFLTPLPGNWRKRGGSKGFTVRMAGITAQKIRHLDILLLDPWVVTLDPSSDVPLPAPTDIRVANPLCFMVQKFLIRDERRGQRKLHHDLLYIHDTIELFGNHLAAFKKSWIETVKPRLGEAASAQVVKECGQAFSAVDDTIRAAARIPQDRELDPEILQRTCQYAFKEILAA